MADKLTRIAIVNSDKCKPKSASSSFIRIGKIVSLEYSQHEMHIRTSLEAVQYKDSSNISNRMPTRMQEVLPGRAKWQTLHRGASPSMAVDA